jgi:hypothetical protein
MNVTKRALIRYVGLSREPISTASRALSEGFQGIEVTRTRGAKFASLLGPIEEVGPALARMQATLYVRGAKGIWMGHDAASRRDALARVYSDATRLRARGLVLDAGTMNPEHIYLARPADYPPMCLVRLGLSKITPKLLDETLPALRDAAIPAALCLDTSAHTDGASPASAALAEAWLYDNFVERVAPYVGLIHLNNVSRAFGAHAPLDGDGERPFGFFAHFLRVFPGTPVALERRNLVQEIIDARLVRAIDAGLLNERSTPEEVKAHYYPSDPEAAAVVGGEVLGEGALPADDGGNPDR